jgi:hypothetical protein
MTKLATLLACVLAFGCSLAVAQKRSIPSHSRGVNSGSNCGPVTAKANGNKGPQTTTANCGAGTNASNLPAQGSIARRLLNQKLGKSTSRPGTPDFLPSSIPASGSQVP